jgi:hypothetical protein
MGLTQFKGKNKDKTVPVHIMKAYRGMKAQVYSFFTSELNSRTPCAPAALVWENNPRIQGWMGPVAGMDAL